MAYVAEPIVLDEQTRLELKRRVRAGTTPQRDVRRARVILLAADGVSSRQIARRVGMHESYVAVWRRRFREDGLEGLGDRPRSGRPVIYDHDDRVKIVALASTTRDDESEPEAVWTYQALTDALRDEVGISRSQLWRILGGLDLKPRRHD